MSRRYHWFPVKQTHRPAFLTDRVLELLILDLKDNPTRFFFCTFIGRLAGHKARIEFERFLLREEINLAGSGFNSHRLQEVNPYSYYEFYLDPMKNRLAFLRALRGLPVEKD